MKLRVVVEEHLDHYRVYAPGYMIVGIGDTYDGALDNFRKWYVAGGGPLMISNSNILDVYIKSITLEEENKAV